MIEFANVPLLCLHLICVNFCSGGPLLAVMLGFGRLSQRDDTRAIVLRIALWSNLLLFVGAAAGVVMGFISVMAGDDSLIDVLPFFRRKITWGIIELLCSVVWMLLFWVWLCYRPPISRFARIGHASLAVLSATNLLYHFPILLTVLNMAAKGEIEVSQHVDAATFRTLAFTPNILAHSVHFGLASIAVSGVMLFWLTSNTTDRHPYHTFGARVALGATILQLPVGLWLLFVTPPQDQARLVSGADTAMLPFVVALLCVFYLLQTLAGIAFGEASEKLTRRATWLMGITVFLMTVSLYLLRHN